MKVKPSRTVLMDNSSEDAVFSLTLVGNIRLQTGKLKLFAHNIAGEATTEANLSISGSPPAFAENPYISQVLEGTQFCWRFSHTVLTNVFSTGAGNVYFVFIALTASLL